MRPWRRGAGDTPAAAVPAGRRLYAIGDVHGRVDLLDRLLALIADDAAASPWLQHTLVFLGDYVDRGPDSRGVLDRLCAAPPSGFGTICLMGNHEATMLRFLEDPRVGVDWLRFGGAATLMSYGIHRSPDEMEPAFLVRASRLLAERLPPDHLGFLRSLELHVAVGGYLFVHAGIRPGVPVARQREEDLLWIRGEFLDSTLDHGAVVVHGHTVTAEPQVRHNRIGIDTGAFASGRLTALVLEETGRRFLCTMIV